MTESLTFDAIPLTAEVRRAIDEIGYTQPTPVQVAAFGPATSGKDLIVQARTGTGKTAAFGLPLVDRLTRPEPETQALILAPTRELALQSAREIAKLGKYRGITTTAIYGGAPMERQIQELAHGAQIVSGTPGRVLDHLKRGTLKAKALKILVLDEADEMLSMGFAKELHAILEFLTDRKQTFFFSATVDDGVKRLAERHMKDIEFVALSSDAVGAATISHAMYAVSGMDRPRDLIRILEVEDPESAIVFCNTKAETERVSQELSAAGYDADWLNGDLPQSDRERVMERTRKGQLRFLVATDVAARGIDVSHLTHVINYALPESAENYVHRTGRTGRAGRTGTAISLVGPREVGSLYYLRLQYKIFPIERTLPNAGDERTRREVDRLNYLSEAVKVMKPSASDRAVAKRLMTHDDAEGIVAGLIATLFGAKEADVDQEAAAMRRAKPPREVPEARRSATREERAATAERREPKEPRERREPREHRRDRSEVSAPPAATDDSSAKTLVFEAAEATTILEPRDRPQRRTRSSEPRAPRGDAEGAQASDADDAAEALASGMVMLFVNVGRKDGAKPGELSRLMRERAGLDAAEVGRIRVRDKHTFVGVPIDKSAAVIERLAGIEFLGRTLAPEPARR